MTSAQEADTQTDGSPGRSSLEIYHDGDSLVVSFGGCWTTQEVGSQDAALGAIDPKGAAHAVLELSALDELDTAGAWLVHRTARDLESAGLSVELSGAREAFTTLIDTVTSHDVPCPEPPRPDPALIAIVLKAGEESVHIVQEARDMLAFLGHTIIVFVRTLLHPSRIRRTALVSHMEHAGLNALPIVGLISFLIGVVLAYQGADQLERFGAQIFTINLVGIGVLREMGIILTAIIVAGRSGSAFTAQIGTMKVNEEIDALRTIGLDPMEVLVIPRVLALVLVLPLLTFYADIMGIAGGAVMVLATLDISLGQFLRQLNDAVPIWSFWVGIIKAPIFAFIIAMVGCYEGFKVTLSAESVGLRTTSSVVKAIFLVIVLDAFFSIFFSYVGV